MSRLGFALRAIALAVTVALPVSADAPRELPDKQYEDFTASSKVITDRFTGLIWERTVPSVKTFDEAKAYCAAGSRRLPSLKELLTLVDEEPHEEYEVNQNVQKMIDVYAFRGTPSDQFWTSTPDAQQNGYWTVNFRDGTTAVGRASDPRYVRCVDVP